MDVTKEEADGQSKVSPINIVIIDGDESFAASCSKTLEKGGYRVTAAKDGQQGLKLLDTAGPAVVLLDPKMAGMDVPEVLRRLSETQPSIVPIVITGQGTVNSAVESMKAGAFDFLSKQVKPEKLLDTVRRAVSLSALRKEAKETGKAVSELRRQPSDKYDLLLQGLDVLGEAYSLGLEKRQLLDELAYLESEAKHHAESLGQIKKKERAILDIRNDLLAVDAMLKKYDFQKSSLIQVLLDVQEHFRWLPRHVLNWIAGRLNIPLREIYIVANFYEAFSLEPRGRHTVQVCTGTACYLRGASELLIRASALLGIQPGQTDIKQSFTLETVHCLGCCALAPVVQIDTQYYHDPSRSKLEKVVKSLEKEEALA
jgi:NADH-quinone oxidoreductase subunit E